MDSMNPRNFLLQRYVTYHGVLQLLVREEIKLADVRFIEAPRTNADLTSEKVKRYYPNRWMYFWPNDVFEEFVGNLLTSHEECMLIHESYVGVHACERHDRHLSGKAGLPPGVRFSDGQMIYYCTKRELPTLGNLLYWVAGDGTSGSGVIVSDDENWRLKVESPQPTDWIFRFSGRVLYFFMKDGTKDDTFLVAQFHPHETTE